MVDERDLGNRPAVAALLPLMDRIDVERAKVGELVASDIARAIALVQRGEYLEAAALFESVSAAFRTKCFIGDADQWAHRARDCRAAAKLKTRSARKGKGRR